MTQARAVLVLGTKTFLKASDAGSSTGVAAPEADIHPGSSGDAVKALYACLLQLKYVAKPGGGADGGSGGADAGTPDGGSPVPASTGFAAGSMDDSGQEALKHFQLDSRIRPDGDYGATARAKLKEALANNKVAQPYDNYDVPGEPPAGSPSDMDVPPAWGYAKTLPDPQYYFGSITDRWTRRLFLKLREGRDLSDDTQRLQFIQEAKQKTALGREIRGTLYMDMPGWVKLTTETHENEPLVWDGVTFPEHTHYDPDHCADINRDPASTYPHKSPVLIFGPMVDFTVELKKGADIGFGGAVYVRLNDRNEWFAFGHMCEISEAVYTAPRDHLFHPGTYLGTCRTCIGLTTASHCHIQVYGPPYNGTVMIRRDTWIPLLTTRPSNVTYDPREPTP